MLNYEVIKKYYDKGLWTDDMVKNAVKKGKITVEEYETVTGEVYEG